VEKAVAQSARTRTPVLDVAFESSGPADGPPVLLLHGFPYDVRSFDGVVALVNAAGFRTIVPWLRGYGGTQFLSANTLRSGEQAGPWSGSAGVVGCASHSEGGACRI